MARKVRVGVCCGERYLRHDDMHQLAAGGSYLKGGSRADAGRDGNHQVDCPAGGDAQVVVVMVVVTVVVMMVVMTW